MFRMNKTWQTYIELWRLYYEWIVIRLFMLWCVIRYIKWIHWLNCPSCFAIITIFCVLPCSCWCLFGVRVVFYCLCETFMPNHYTIPWSLNPNIYLFLHHLIEDKNVLLRSIFVHTLPALSTKIFADYYYFISDRHRYVIKREIRDTLKKKKNLLLKNTA